MCASDVKQMKKSRRRAPGTARRARRDVPRPTLRLTELGANSERATSHQWKPVDSAHSAGGGCRGVRSGSRWWRRRRCPPRRRSSRAYEDGDDGDAAPQAPEAAAVGGRGGRAPGAARRGARGEGVGEDRAVPAHAQRQAVPRAVPQPPAPRALQGRVVGRGGHRDLEPRARGGHEVGGDLRAVHADADGQRHQEPVELDHPEAEGAEAACGPTRRRSSAWPSSATRRARACPSRPPARRTLRAAAAAPPPPPARPPAQHTRRWPTLTRRTAALRRDGRRQRTQVARRKTQQPKSKHQPRAAHADGAMDDGESPSRGRRLFRSPNAGSPSGGALVEGALGRRRRTASRCAATSGEAAGDSVGTPAPVTRGGGGGRRRRRRARPRRCSAPPPRRVYHGVAVLLPRLAGHLRGTPPSASTSARRSAGWARPSSTASPPPASSARRCRC